MILIRKVKDEYGWLGNMSPFPVLYEGKKYRTTEALFQALRFDDEKIIESIRDQKSPMSAKMKAKKHRDRMVVVPMSEADLDNMRLVLRLKLLQQSKRLRPDQMEYLKVLADDELQEQVAADRFVNLTVKLNEEGVFAT